MTCSYQRKTAPKSGSEGGLEIREHEFVGCVLPRERARGMTGAEASDKGYTPAQLEQLCAECDTVAQLLKSLRENATLARGASLARSPSLARGTSLARAVSRR